MPPKFVGPNIVRAWFDTVVNPALRGLELEERILGSKNLTWRYQPSGFEYLRPIRTYVGHEGIDNLEQFLDLNKKAESPIREHDSAIDELAASCQALHELLANSNEVKSIYEQTTSDISLAELKTTIHSLFGAYSKEDHIRLLAQYIVNNTQELASHYTTAPLWNRYRNSFLAIANNQPFKTKREVVDKSIDKLRDAATSAYDVLKDIRMQLSLKHDVPYTPPPRPGGPFGSGTIFGSSY